MKRWGDLTAELRGAVVRAGVFAGVATVVLILGWRTPLREAINHETMAALAERLGVWGPLAILAYGILSPLCFLPRFPIAMAAGLLYGVAWGTALAMTASVLGAWLNFRLARGLLSPLADRVRARFAIGPGLPSMRQLFVMILLMRAVPFFSFVVTNLFAGAIRVRTGVFLSASVLGMIPSTAMYAAGGTLLTDPTPGHYAVVVAMLAVLLVGAIAGLRRLGPWIEGIKRGGEGAG